jgi:hypothetical protein
MPVYRQQEQVTMPPALVYPHFAVLRNPSDPTAGPCTIFHNSVCLSLNARH